MKKNKNDLHAMKQILYDMGLLTLVSWLLQRAFKFAPPCPNLLKTNSIDQDVLDSEYLNTETVEKKSLVLCSHLLDILQSWTRDDRK